MDYLIQDHIHLIRSYQMEIGEAYIFEDLLICEIMDGVNLELETFSEFLGITERYYKERPFVYISQRKNSYAVDPMLYPMISRIEMLKGIAIVSNKEVDVHNLKIEKYFFQKPMELFNDLLEAVEWSQGLLRRLKRAD